jgi:O-antigen/teichoic acid export membrane protein
MNTGIIRYLPKPENKNDKINTVLVVVAVASLVTTTIYIIGLNKFAPKLLFIRENVYLLVFFTLVALASAIESIYSSSFIAFRDTKYVLINNAVKSVIKLLFPVFLVALGSYAIFASASIGSIFVVFISVYVLSKFYQYRFKLTFSKNIFLDMYKFSFGNYIATLISGLPITILPILITNTLGPKQAAYYYIDSMIIALIGAIQSSINNSLFAEASTDEKKLKYFILRSFKPMALLLIPAILITIFFGGFILHVFGKEYSAEGLTLLRLLAISVVFTTVNGTLSTILNVKSRINLVLLMCFIGPLILLSLVYFMLPYGLVSLGYAWLIGEALIALIYVVIIFTRVL